MNCPYCGHILKSEQSFCSHCGAAVGQASTADAAADTGVFDSNDWYTPEAVPVAMEPLPITVPRTSSGRHRRGKPSLALRVPLQLFSFLVSLVLLVSLLATALLLDCNRLLSAAGIKQVMNAVFSVSQSRSTPQPIVGALGAGASMDLPSSYFSDIEVPTDVLTSGDAEALIDWVYTMAQQVAGEEITIDRKQVQTFVEDSTLTDYLSEKAAGYAADFINGTAETQITGQELLELLEENEALIENTFQIELSNDLKQELKTSMDAAIAESNINEKIHEEVFSAMEQALDEALPLEWAKLQSLLQTLTSDNLLLGALGLCMVLMLVLCGLNFYNLPAGLTWSAVPCIVAGVILSLPIALLTAAPELLTQLLALPDGIAQLIASFMSAFSLVHYGLLFFGLAMLALSILWRILRAVSRSRDTY